MGNLLKVLTREIENYPHFFLDFESKSGRGVEQREKEMDGWRCGEGEGGSTVSSLSAGLCSRRWSHDGVCFRSGLLSFRFFVFPPIPLLFSFHSAVTSCCFCSDLPSLAFLKMSFNITRSSLPFFSFFSLFCRNQMGNLLKVLTCTELEQGPNFFLDFESENGLSLSFCLPGPPSLPSSLNSFSLGALCGCCQRSGVSPFS